MILNMYNTDDTPAVLVAKGSAAHKLCDEQKQIQTPWPWPCW